MSKIDEFGAALMDPGSRGCDAGLAVWPALMPGAGLHQCLIDARFDVALRLPTNGGQLRDDQIPRPLKHALFAKRQRLYLAEVAEMLEHVGNLKDVAGAHFFGKLLEAILPIVGRSGKVAGEGFEKHIAFARRNRTTQANFRSIRNRNQNQRVRRGETERIERKRYCSDLFLLDLFNYSDTVIWVNNFLADLEAHLCTSAKFYEHPASRIARLLDKNTIARLKLETIGLFLNLNRV